MARVLVRITVLTLMAMMAAGMLIILMNGLPHDPAQWVVFSIVVVCGPLWVYVHNNHEADELTRLKAEISGNLRALRATNPERADCLGKAYRSLDLMRTYDIRRYAWLNELIKDELLENAVSVSRVA